MRPIRRLCICHKHAAILSERQVLWLVDSLLFFNETCSEMSKSECHGCILILLFANCRHFDAFFHNLSHGLGGLSIEFFETNDNRSILGRNHFQMISLIHLSIASIFQGPSPKDIPQDS